MAPPQAIKMALPGLFVQTEIAQLISSGRQVPSELLPWINTFLETSTKTIAHHRSELRRLRHIESQLSSLLAPIRRLPPEVLSRIFIFLVEENNFYSEEVEQSHSEASQIGLVCTYWRKVSLDTPEIWGRLRVEVEFDNPPPPVMAERLVLHIQRAREFPLELQLHVIDSGGNACPDTRTWDEITMPILQVLDPFTHHVRNLELVVIWEGSLSSECLFSIVPTRFSALRSLSIRFYNEMDWGYSSFVLLDKSETASMIEDLEDGCPSLQSFSFVHAYNCGGTMTGLEPIFNISQRLTELRVRVHAIIPLFALRALPNLSSAHFILSLNAEWEEAVDSPESGVVYGHIKLQHLSIDFNDDNTVEKPTTAFIALCKIFRGLQCPSLLSLSIEASGIRSNTALRSKRNGYPEFFTSAIMSLLESTTSLTSLALIHIPVVLDTSLIDILSSTAITDLLELVLKEPRKCQRSFLTDAFFDFLAGEGNNDGPESPKKDSDNGREQSDNSRAKDTDSSEESLPDNHAISEAKKEVLATSIPLQNLKRLCLWTSRFDPTTQERFEEMLYTRAQAEFGPGSVRLEIQDGKNELRVKESEGLERIEEECANMAVVVCGTED
ncbi:hypothetical protein V5O48_013419 [Marasmius crinis-equi]|uniref:F-box domain-containing protein n=1 Tax=Marasmius crinis-equi TaxID=585013 RepID=A0ABR3F0J3_9AGAR